MATVNLGRVGLVLKGDWDSATAYVPLDVVSHDGNSWAAKRNNTNVEPTTESSNDWQLISNNSDLVATVQGYKEDAETAAGAAAQSAADAETSAQSITKVIAPTEASSTASAAYAVGEYFIYNGKLYAATAAIAQGGTITPGTNCEEVPNGLSGEVSEVKSAVFNGYTTLRSSDFAQGNWKSAVTFDPDTKTIGVKTPIPVKAGQKFSIKTSGQYVTTFIYNSEMTQVVARPINPYISFPAETTIAIENDGNLAFNVRTSANYNTAQNITPSDYSCEIKIFQTYTDSVIKPLENEIDQLHAQVYYTDTPVLSWVEGLCNVGNFTTKAGDMVSRPFLLQQGKTVTVKTKGDGAYLFRTIASVPSLDIPIASGYSGGTKIAAITNNNLTSYSHTAEADEYIVLGALIDETTEISFSGYEEKSKFDKLQDEIDGANAYNTGILRKKSVMFFGDSLTAASTSGVIGFAERMANDYNIPYKLFVLDSNDGNTEDVPVDYARFTNYAKDGTTNRIMTGRTDSVVERIKRHINADTLIDYVLFECCVNDMAQANQNKGTISASYTGPFDTSTTIGSIEETLMYLTTLGKPIRVGAFIPWTIQWQVSGWFDDYAAVFEKWGVPLFDMRKIAGFDMQHCSAHRLIYSLSSDNYDAYDPSATYNLDDKVKYGGTLYKCNANGVTGIPPTNTDYWIEVSSESADGTHLNSLGHFVVAGKIEQFITGC